MIIIDDSDKHYLLSLIYATGIILFWRGLWGIADITPLINNVFVSLFVGLVILTLSGIIYHEFDPFARKLTRISRLITNVMNEAKQHGKKYTVFYHDRLANKHNAIDPAKIIRVEKDYFIIDEGKREHFVPIHRVSQIHHQGKAIWKR